MLKSTVLGVALAFGVAFSAAAEADAVVFRDRGDFTSDFGTMTSAMEDVDISYTSTVPIDGLVFIAKMDKGTPEPKPKLKRKFGIGAAFPFVADNGPVQRESVQRERQVADRTANPIYGFGFELPDSAFDCGSSVCTGRPLIVDIYSDDVLVDSFEFFPGAQNSAFFGVVRGTPINRFVISERLGTDDGQIFGAFGTKAQFLPPIASQVPVPGSSVLLLAGLAGLGALKRRRSRECRRECRRECSRG